MSPTKLVRIRSAGEDAALLHAAADILDWYRQRGTPQDAGQFNEECAEYLREVAAALFKIAPRSRY